MRLVTEELSRLDHEAERAERAAERWEQIAAKFDAQRATHRAEDNKSDDVLRQAEEEAARVRAEVVAPLTEQAERDGAAYLASVEAERTAKRRLATVGRFGRRKARDEHRAASEQAATLRAHVRDAWEVEPPRTPSSLPEWAAQVAERRAEADLRLSDAAQVVEAAHAGRVATGERHRNERLALLAREYGPDNARAHQYGMRALNPRRDASDARARSTRAHAEADELRSLPGNDAARRIEAKRVEQEQLRLAAQLARQLNLVQRTTLSGDPGRDGPARGL